jgi:CheY-like chemotaxis protein
MYCSSANQLRITRFGDLKVLVCDGSRHMRSLILGILLGFGIRRTREATDGSEALEILANWSADIILTELEMRPLDGIDFIRLLRGSEHLQSRFVPIVVLTAWSEKRNVVAARDAGINEFLAKPVTPAALLSRLNEVILRPRSFVRTKSYFGPDRRRRPERPIGDKERRGRLVAALPEDRPLTQEEIGLVLDEHD